MNEKDIQKFFEERGRQERILKEKKHEQLTKTAFKGQIVFVGSSLMEQFPIEEMAQRLPNRPVVYNRGIGGDTIDGLDGRLNAAVIDLAPRKLFINIGTNDISAENYVRENMLAKYRALLEKIRAALPETKIIIMSYYPVNRTDKFVTTWFRARTNQEIDAVNAELKLMAEDMGLGYVNVTDCLRDENGDLIAEYAIDGMHMLPEGYEQVFNIIRPMIY
ncbi:MAG: lysophospholipase [Clostridia bacterium]|nr:lysophospholipase [Clostridia bacterium]